MSEKIKLRIGIILLIASIVFLTSCGTKNINETKTAEVSSSSSEFNELSENNNHDSGSTAVSRKFGAKKSPTSSENTVKTNNNNSSDAQNYDSHNDYNTNHYENNEASSENNAYYAADSNTEETESSAANNSSNSEQNTLPDTHAGTCSFTIDCKNAIASTKLSSSMRDILPSDGIIYKSQNLELTSGETVFDILLKITRQSGIPMEFSSTPAFGSKYIEGINSLREFDCGETSGWKYSVNGEVPNYGCDKYTVNPGDDIIFYYVTDWGSDL